MHHLPFPKSIHSRLDKIHDPVLAELRYSSPYPMQPFLQTYPNIHLPIIDCTNLQQTMIHILQHIHRTKLYVFNRKVRITILLHNTILNNKGRSSKRTKMSNLLQRHHFAKKMQFVGPPANGVTQFIQQ